MIPTDSKFDHAALPAPEIPYRRLDQSPDASTENPRDSPQPKQTKTTSEMALFCEKASEEPPRHAAAPTINITFVNVEPAPIIDLASLLSLLESKLTRQETKNQRRRKWQTDDDEDPDEPPSVLEVRWVKTVVPPANQP